MSESSTTPGRALFLDRDGVINVEVGYLSRPEQVSFVEGVFSLCRTAKQLGYMIFIVTNQSGIARGYYSLDDFAQLMKWMRGEFRILGAEIDEVYFCPYHPEHGVGEYRREHEDRKPGIGMLRKAATEFKIDLGRSVMVGDRCSDVLCATAAGLRQAFLLLGTELGPCPGIYKGVSSLKEVEEWLLFGN